MIAERCWCNVVVTRLSCNLGFSLEHQTYIAKQRHTSRGPKNLPPSLYCSQNAGMIPSTIRLNHHRLWNVDNLEMFSSEHLSTFSQMYVPVPVHSLYRSRFNHFKIHHLPDGTTYYLFYIPPGPHHKKKETLILKQNSHSKATYNNSRPVTT